MIYLGSNISIDLIDLKVIGNILIKLEKVEIYSKTYYSLNVMHVSDKTYISADSVWDMSLTTITARFNETVKTYERAVGSAGESKSVDPTKVCLLCGNEMLSKIGKHGRFFGCSKWPDCECTVNKKGVATKKTLKLLGNKIIKTNNDHKEDDPLDNRLDSIDIE